VAIVASGGRLVDLGYEETVPQSYGYSPLMLQRSYELIWRTQPAVRTVCTFLARNIAQLGLHVFRRVSDVERLRVTDHPFADTISHPNDDATTYELIDSLVNDLAIYDNAYWVKVRPANEPQRIGLVRIPPWRVEVRSSNWLTPESYRVHGTQGYSDIAAADVVHFRGYNPVDPRVGVSPIESLRQLLAEDLAATKYRARLWQHEARISGVIERPPDVDWSDAARERFRDEWRSLYSANGSDVGGTPILEDGMTYKPFGYSAEQSQYVEARKLAREEVAAAYHIPPPMVGILEHATFSNITEQHKNLYQDTLGPWLAQITQRIDLRLLPDYPDSDGLYSEFNLAEKLRGSFEEQTRSMQVAVGAPMMTRNEGRARLNLPPIDGGDELVVPLNVVTTSDTVAPQPDVLDQPAAAARALPVAKAAGIDRVDEPDVPDDPPAPRAQRFADPFARIAAQVFAQQAEAVVPRLTIKRKALIDDVFDRERWNSELATLLFAVNVDAGLAAARRTIADLGGKPADFRKETILAWLAANADGVAASVNDTTVEQLDAALLSDDPLAAVRSTFDNAVNARAPKFGVTQATAIGGFGSLEGARFARATHKVWNVRTRKPRPSHAALHGRSVLLEDKFSNGCRWPGDSMAAPDERGNCTCELTYTGGAQ